MKHTSILLKIFLCSAFFMEDGKSLRSDDEHYTDKRQLTDDVSVYYKLVKVNDEASNKTVSLSPNSTDTNVNALSIKLVYKGLAWISFGIAPNSQGRMMGSESIIGVPDEAVSVENPGRYKMTEYFSDAVFLERPSKQTLVNASVSQNSSGITTLTFIKLLNERKSIYIDKDGNHTFVS